MSLPETEKPMEPLRLSSSLTITYPDKTLEFVCPPRSVFKQLRSSFVELQSLWIEQGFSTADLIASDRGWELMGAIAKLFPRKDNPAVTGFDLELLQTDLLQLEELFLTRDRSEIYAYKSDSSLVINIFVDVFKGCTILEFCRFEPRMVLGDAHGLWQERQKAAEQPEEEAVATLAVTAEPIAEPEPVADITPAKRQRKAS